MTMRWHHLNLQVKVSIIILLIVGLSLFIADYVDRHYVAKLVQENFYLKVATLLREVETRIQTSAQFQNQTDREKQFNKLIERHPDLLEVRLYTLPSEANGRPSLVARVPSTRHDPTTSTKIPPEVDEVLATTEAASNLHAQVDQRYMAIAVPVFVQEELAGVIFAKFWTGQIATVLEHHRRWSFILRIVVGGLIVLAINMFFYFRVHRPLSSLQAAVKAITGQDLKTTLQVRRNDEIGQLARHFNLMVERIRGATEENQGLYQALKESHDNLKGKIDDATEELLKRNEELVMLNERFSSAQRETTRLQRLAVLGQIVATVAHKIGTPLTAIYGHIQLLEEDPELSVAARERIQTLMRQIERMSRIIQDLLLFGRKSDPCLIQVDINSNLEQTLNLFRPILDRQHIELTTAFGANVESVLGDPSQLQEVFANLIDNALEAMPDGGRLFIQTVRQTADEEGGLRDWVSIAIGDTGPGIPPEDRTRIFEPFFTTKKTEGGTGLGLAITLELVKEQNGEVRIESTVGKGTTFTVRLPAS